MMFLSKPSFAIAAILLACCATLASGGRRIGAPLGLKQDKTTEDIFLVKNEHHRRERELKQSLFVGNNGSPSDRFPLGECEGDCDGDGKCFKE